MPSKIPPGADFADLPDSVAEVARAAMQQAWDAGSQPKTPKRSPLAKVVHAAMGGDDLTVRQWAIGFGSRGRWSTRGACASKKGPSRCASGGSWRCPGI